MKRSHDHLNVDELGGTTQADYRVSLDPRSLVLNGRDTVWDEPDSGWVLLR